MFDWTISTFDVKLTEGYVSLIRRLVPLMLKTCLIGRLIPLIFDYMDIFFFELTIINAM